MISRRIISKNFLKNKLPLQPQLALTPHLKNQYNPQLTLQPYQQLRLLATHVEEFEIDYISLTKRAKKPDFKKNVNKQPVLNLETPGGLWYPFEKLIDYNEPLCEPLLDFYYWEGNVRNEEGELDDLAFAKEFYTELLVFQHFLQEAYEYRIKQFSDLTNTEVINALYIFKDYYTRGEIHEVTNTNEAKYNDMTKFFLEFVKEDPSFIQNLSTDLLPQVQKSEEIMDFLENGLYFYIPELKSLDQEFNFKKIRSKTDLLLQIEKMLKNFDEYLESNSKVDEMFFKISVQVARYKTLKSMLEVTKTPLKLIKKIITKNDFSDALWYKTFENCEKDVNFTTYDQYALIWNKLYFANQIPKTKNFFKLATSLYNITQDEGNPFKEEAEILFDALMEDQLKAGKILPTLVEEDLELLNIKFTSNFEDNFKLNFLYSIGYNFENKLDADTSQELWKHGEIVPGFIFALFHDLNFDKLNDLISTPEVFLKYLELKGQSLARCFPLDSMIMRYLKNLKSLKNKYDISFDLFASTRELCDFISSETDADIGFIKAIEETSIYCGNNLKALDDLVEELEEDEIESLSNENYEEKLDKHTSSSYKQLPDWLRLENHIPEIEFLKETLGSFEEKDKVLKKAGQILEEILNDDSKYPEINHGSFNKLVGKLREFSINNTKNCLEILNTVVLNNDIFAQFEKSKNSKLAPTTESSTTYVQIPDDLQLSSFTNELTKLKESLGGQPFESHDREKIINTLNYQIDQYFAESNNGVNLLASNNSEIFQCIRLKRRLARLFDLNGNHTMALDVLLNSQSVFEEFEKGKEVVVKPEYKQIPNDFQLEEYIIELEQLKNALNIEKFEDVNAADILAKVKNLSDASYATKDKKIIWNKLYRNLAMLFKHNNNSSFALDNVVTSAKVFKNVQNIFKKNAKNAIEQQTEFFKAAEVKVLESFLNESRLLSNSDLYLVSKAKFEDLINKYASSLDSSSSEYLFQKAVLDQLKQYNLEIEHYPAFITCLFAMNKSIVGPMTSDTIKEFYNDLKKSFDGKAEEAVAHGSTSVSSKFDMDQFKQNITTTKTNNQYHDSEKYFADLDKKEETVADFEINDEHFAPGTFQVAEDDFATFVYEKENMKEPLKPVKFEKEIKDVEEKNSLKESQLPIENLANEKVEPQESEEKDIGWEEPYEELPGYSSSYMLLTLNGDSIPISKSLLGNIKSDEDIFQILRNFSKEELLMINEKLNNLQFKNWKIVGYKIMDGRKYLILSKDSTTSNKFGKVKDIFSVVGIILLSLIGLNMYWEEPMDYKENQHQQNEPLRVIDDTIVPNVGENMYITHEEDHAQKPKETRSSWRKIFWA
ncbi:uncharacterized protein KGF55_001879 [Candida pseudojiufengensis]|uniref:uncharacterized protein n=1 Tax=Candida pseudojiufengensis TaxID=497109 RepID=UPI0022247866|nr:uncharacterized protein KGF55_001879 [Candida pseudojiufengensis]KAI5964809.1 hypothetical protein KGF55_001879 [Candida pseudojiufengensis]